MIDIFWKQAYSVLSLFFNVSTDTMVRISIIKIDGPDKTSLMSYEEAACLQKYVNHPNRLNKSVTGFFGYHTIMPLSLYNRASFNQASFCGSKS
jgi:hypothetical protein